MSLINKDNNGKGIVVQMKELGVDNVKDTLTYEAISKIIKDIMYGNPESTNLKERKGIFKKVPEGFDLDFQIQEGYMYQTEGPVKLMTGSGGMRSMIEAARKLGLSDEIIAQDIYVTDYYNKDSKAYWIGDVVWKKIEK